jgi:hypothetical protein
MSRHHVDDVDAADDFALQGKRGSCVADAGAAQTDGLLKSIWDLFDELVSQKLGGASAECAEFSRIKKFAGGAKSAPPAKRFWLG